MLSYPEVRRSDFEETLHGVQVPDPYRWLEDPDSEETKAFVVNQNQLTAEYLTTQIEDTSTIQTRMTQLYNYEKYSCPTQHGQSLFFFKNDGLQNQSVLYQQRVGEGEEEARVLLDPNTLSSDGTAALGAMAFSEGKVDDKLYFAHGISRGGSDWQTIKVLAVHEDGKLLDDTVEWVKFSSISWSHDDKGFFYARFPTPATFTDVVDNSEDSKCGTETEENINHQIWYHQLYTDQSEDQLIYEYPSNPKYYVNAEVSDDGNSLIISVSDGCKNACMIHIADLTDFRAKADAPLPVKKIANDMESNYEYILNRGEDFYFKTNMNAPRERIVKYKISAFDENCSNTNDWHEVIAEPEGTIVLQSVSVTKGDFLLVKYMEDVKNVLKVYDLANETWKGEITLPSVGTVIVASQRRYKVFFFKFVSFLYPGSIYRCDIDTCLTTGPVLFRETEVAGFQRDLYEAKQVFYPSKDGTRIPMFLVGKKEVLESKNNDSPTYLYGYGGFNISLTPNFSLFRLIFVQHFDGLVALPNLRGGGEYGEEWHQQGIFGRKQNVFDDFQYAAQFLIDQNYTRANRIAIHGGSNGGLLVGACINQRPDLFGCGVAAVGVMDMLRFHKFTCGHGWRTDYGDPDKPDDFGYLRAYSPIHNVSKNALYPALLLTTGDHDDRVVPLHSYKFIAELQHQLGETNLNPLLIRIETQAGHGAGKPTAKIIQESSEVLAFIGHSLKAPFVV